jgi:hypothetical protein
MFRVIVPAFDIGDRVRIRVSAECAVLGETTSQQDTLDVAGHPAWMDGLTGTVIGIDDAPELSVQRHPYLVRWDVGRVIDGLYFRRSHYAASELEAL